MNRSKASYFKKEEPKVVHRHIICDECGWKDIEGVRYKCSVLADYDLCEKCEATSNHKYPLLKIKHPRQAPLKIITIINDEEDAVEINGKRVHSDPFQGLLDQGLQLAQQYLEQARVPTEETSVSQEEKMTKECTESKPSTQVEKKVEFIAEEKKAEPIVEEQKTEPIIEEEPEVEPIP